MIADTSRPKRFDATAAPHSRLILMTPSKGSYNIRIPQMIIIIIFIIKNNGKEYQYFIPKRINIGVASSKLILLVCCCYPITFSPSSLDPKTSSLYFLQLRHFAQYSFETL